MGAMAQREDVWFTAGDDRISAWLYRDAARVSVPPKHTQRQRHFAIYVDPKLSGLFERAVADQITFLDKHLMTT